MTSFLSDSVTRPSLHTLAMLRGSVSFGPDFTDDAGKVETLVSTELNHGIQKTTTSENNGNHMNEYTVQSNHYNNNIK